MVAKKGENPYPPLSSLIRIMLASMLGHDMQAHDRRGNDTPGHDMMARGKTVHDNRLHKRLSFQPS
ncbi:MAG: hypothetical protein MUO68_10030 [Desulfobacteraceae bacterium]|nr:hypothetical protein [Desulfobacteraceae bacterium]